MRIGIEMVPSDELPSVKTPIPVQQPKASPFSFSRSRFDCAVGGRSVLDLSRLEVKSKEEAHDFLVSYGYDVSKESDREELWSIHSRAITLIREQLLDVEEKIPVELVDPAKLEDLRELLLFASKREPGTIHLQRWACAILKVMHVYVHLKNDMFSVFRDEIQGQILDPLERVIVRENDKFFVHTGEQFEISHFEVKPFKTTASAVIKLLAKPERVALTLLDKIGVRFVTRNMFDAFRIVRGLVDSHALSYPHIIPDQSSNTLYPLNLFFETMDEFVHSQAAEGAIADDVIEEWLKKNLEMHKERAEFKEKINVFSGPDHRFIKFISRRLITVNVGVDKAYRSFRFFYPFEVQIMDEQTWEKTKIGDTAHDQYKERQRKRARERALGMTSEVL